MRYTNMVNLLYLVKFNHIEIQRTRKYCATFEKRTQNDLKRSLKRMGS